MSDTPPDHPGGPDEKLPKKPARTNAGFYLLLGCVITGLIAWSLISREEQREPLEFSTLYYGLTNPDAEQTFGAENVHELKVGRSAITFQDRPNDEDDVASEGTTFYEVPIVNLDEETLHDLNTALLTKGIQVAGGTAPPAWQQGLYMLVLCSLFLLALVILLRRVGGTGSALSFGRSRGRLFAQEDLGITFKDVAGIDEAKQELREVVDFLKNPQKYQAIGGRIPKGVLLVGPPGTGKTLLAKAVAGEAGVPFFGLSGSDFVEMFVGVGAARVRDMFQQACAKSPAIIFIDELDALGKARGNGLQGGNDEREQTLNALLVEMDGFGSDETVIVIGATNRPETLDPALMRPGRFDRQVLVDRPDINGRVEVLKVHVQRIKMDDSVDLERLAKITSGFVGADLANLVNEAALLAARQGKELVTMSDFEEAVERVVAGLEKSSGIIHEETKVRVAWHECGHALVACCLPTVDPVHKISIIPRGLGALGYTMQRPEDDRQLITQSEIEGRICVLLGGITAEEIVYQETSTGAQNDLQRATDLARRMVTEFGMSPKLGRVHYSDAQTSPFLGAGEGGGPQSHSQETLREIDLEIKRILDECGEQVRDLLTTNREVLKHMTDDLLELEVMDAAHLETILDQHSTGPRLKPGTFVNPPEPAHDSLEAQNNDVPPALGEA